MKPRQTKEDAVKMKVGIKVDIFFNGYSKGIGHIVKLVPGNELPDPEVMDMYFKNDMPPMAKKVMMLDRFIVRKKNGVYLLWMAEGNYQQLLLSRNIAEGKKRSTL